jgi:hypothetical protein
MRPMVHSTVHGMATHSESTSEATKNMVVRVPTSLVERVEAIAEREQRTLSGEVRWLMERRVREVDAGEPHLRPVA